MIRGKLLQGLEAYSSPLRFSLFFLFAIPSFPSFFFSAHTGQCFSWPLYLIQVPLPNRDQLPPSSTSATPHTFMFFLEAAQAGLAIHPLPLPCHAGALPCLFCSFCCGISAGDTISAGLLPWCRGSPVAPCAPQPPACEGCAENAWDTVNQQCPAGSETVRQQRWLHLLLFPPPIVGSLEG